MGAEAAVRQDRIDIVHDRSLCITIDGRQSPVMEDESEDGDVVVEADSGSKDGEGAE